MKAFLSSMAAILILGLWGPAVAGVVALPGNARLNIKVESMAELRFKNVVRQSFDLSCGAAALATLLQYYYDTPVTEKQIIDDILEITPEEDRKKISKSGFSMLELKRAGERYGFIAGGFQVPDMEKLLQLKVPALTLVNTRGYKHFVVIKGFSERQVFIADPAFGNRAKRFASFADEWNNIVLVFLHPERKGDSKFSFEGAFTGRPGETIPLLDRGLRTLMLTPQAGEY